VSSKTLFLLGSQGSIEPGRNERLRLGMAKRVRGRTVTARVTNHRAPSELSILVVSTSTACSFSSGSV
jgi:hypothetical protein